jgi:SAM-dependent methyltransferase
MKLSKRDRKLQKAQRAAESRAVVDRLATVATWRERFRPLSQQILAGVLASASIPQDALVVEIGAGTGELRRWLPPDLAARTVHTEPLNEAIEELRLASDGAVIVQAGVESLPFASGEVGAVMALCVLDIVPDGAQAAREIARILRPGGVFVHLLDMTTDLSSTFSQVSAAGLVPLPNVFDDPSASRWPEDLLLVPESELVRIRDILRRNSHPLARPLAGYLAVFQNQPLAASRAVAEYNQLANHASNRELLKGMFRTAFELASPDEQEALAKFRGRPAPSSRFFAGRLVEWFSAEAGFEIVSADVVSTAGPVAPASESPHRYFSLSVGEMRRFPSPPPLLLDDELTLEDPGEGKAVGELRMFAFVARRSESPRAGSPAATSG